MLAVVLHDGFFKIAFSAELQLGVPAERVRKFDEPVRIFAVSKGLPDRRSEIAAIVADIRARLNHLDVASRTTARPPTSSLRCLRSAI
jgi:hypothetical protein